MTSTEHAAASSSVTEFEERKTIFNSATCTRKGLCPVTKIRREAELYESHSLYFEQHGSGPNKIVFIIGLNTTSFAWLPQVEYFGSRPEYSVLVFDNRGSGNSDSPKGPYTTPDMAHDVCVLLNYIGWTAAHDLNVVGVSLGGMIALELAHRIPERLISLILCVTTPGGRPWQNLPPVRSVFRVPILSDLKQLKGLQTLTRLMTTGDPIARIKYALPMLFPLKWLDEQAEGDPEGRTNREVQTELFMKRIPYTRRQPMLGALSQMFAAITHYVSPSRLIQISSSVPKILILTGDEDHLVHPRNSKYMKAKMPEAEFIEWSNTGHGLTGQRPEKFNALLEYVIRQGKDNIRNELDVNDFGTHV